MSYVQPLMLKYEAGQSKTFEYIIKATLSDDISNCLLPECILIYFLMLNLEHLLTMNATTSHESFEGHTCTKS